MSENRLPIENASNPWKGGDTINVRQVIDLYSRLGLPHFQRGRVWGNDSIAALLESLFHNTPCGSFVFWKSKDNRANGVPIDESTAAPSEHLVIDGQQRIRSLHDAWNDAPGSDEDDTKSKKIWCINLSRVRRLESMLEQSKKTPTLFVWAPDPADATTKVQARRTNLIPFAAVRAHSNWAALSAYHSLIRSRDKARWDSAVDREYSELRNRVLEMENRSFFVTRRDATSSLAEMAELYNRINAGGKQVETEERAFAALVGLQPGNSAVSDGLRGAFAAVHGESRPLTDRDALMKREQERQFGFKLFIRIFLQVCQYHLGYVTGKSSFSFDPVSRDAFREAFGARTGREVETLWDETLAVTQTIHDVLDRSLNCDDLRMLPDAQGLMPLAQLLIQYPKLREKRYRSLLASLTLRIALAKPDSREWSQWISTAGDPTCNALQSIGLLYEAIAPKARQRFDVAMKSRESSLQDRYVLLLYWLQRKLRTTDFCGECIPDQKARPTGPPKALSREGKPEKGHVIPRSKLAKVFGIDVRPTESHEINSIGNLTYMSYEFNRALGDDFPDLAVELKQARKNLGSHFISSGDSQELYDGYEKLRRLMGRLDQTDEAGFEPRRKNVISKFGKLTKLRRLAIQRSFEAWLEELDADALASLGLKTWEDLKIARTGEHRLEPQKPRFAVEEQDAHLVRELGLLDDAEDHVLGLIRERRPKVKDGVICFQLTKRQQVTVAASRSGVTLRLRQLDGRLRKGALKAVGLSDLEGKEFSLNPVPQFSALVRFCEQNEEAIAAAYSKEQEAKSPEGRRPHLANESEFWAAVRSRAPQIEPVARKLIEPFRRPGFELELGAGSLLVRSRPTDSQLPIPMFFLKKRGVIEFWPTTFTRRAGKAGVGAALTTEYVANMRRLLSRGTDDEARCPVQDADISAIQAVVLEFHRKAAEKSGS